MSNSTIAESLRPQPIEVPVNRYDGRGTMTLHSRSRVEVNVRVVEFRVEYEIHAILTHPEEGAMRWRVEELRGARTDGRGGLSRAAHDELQAALPSRVYYWLQSLPPGAQERAEAEQLLTDAEGTAKLVQSLVERAEKARQSAEEFAQKHAEQTERTCERWMRDVEKRIERYRQQAQERIAQRRHTAAEQAVQLEEARDQIVQRFTEANTF